MAWTDEQENILKERYNDSYEDLMKVLPFSKRVLKRKVAELGLMRDERRKWSEEEFEILRKNPGLSPKEFVRRGLLDRSVFQIAGQLRKTRGTARRLFKISECGDDAYLLGAFCSDACVGPYNVTMMQRVEDVDFLDRVREILEKKGLYVSVVRTKRPLSDGSEKEYLLLSCSARSIFDELATEKGRVAKNIRGPDGEWVDALDEKTPWVWKDEFFWDFIGGLYDGDGCNSGGTVSIAIAPERSSKRISDELEKRGFKTSVRSGSVFVLGEKEAKEEFLSLVRGILSRKKSLKEVIRSKIGESLVEGVQWISRESALQVIEKEHYLGTIPGGSKCVGIVEGGQIVSVGVFRNDRDEAGRRELKRFVTTRHDSGFASKCLARMLRFLGEKEGVKTVVTFADPAEGHKGTIYRAVGGLFLGDTGESIRFTDKNGRRYSGRFATATMRAAGVDIKECVPEIVPGKTKFLLKAGACGEVEWEVYKKKALTRAKM